MAEPRGSNYWDAVFDAAIELTSENICIFDYAPGDASGEELRVYARSYAVELSASLDRGRGAAFDDDDWQMFRADVADRMAAMFFEDIDNEDEDGNAFAVYQKEVNRTFPEKWRDEKGLLIFTLGLCGEAGEFAELIKKRHGHGHDIPRDALCGELGDVLWYLTAIAEWHSFSLADIARQNESKLRARYPDGFDVEKSRNRE